MRLSVIKLAGFKSFVDPASLHLSGAPTAVVGPNGCGKSNVIDAVRWVLGESSARALRGEALEDVIFNGARSRKPVGRAAIELVFDNSDGTLGGEYAGFGEISVKRELVRSGASRYFINGSRCRRRDINDIFLGTGLGNRNSYAVIEQGTISRLIEARPEDMRLIIEEAAGISKYKERRRETENRLRHTRENLDRVEDLKGELDERLSRLYSQAEDAEKYKRCKAEERERKAQLLALRYRDLQNRAAARAEELEKARTALEDVRGQVRQADADGDALRREQEEAAGRAQSLQAEYYNQEAEVARAEQALAHAREMQQVREKERRDVEQKLHDLATRESRQHEDEATLEKQAGDLKQQLAGRDGALEQARAKTREAEQAWEEAQQNWESANHESREPRSRAESESVRAQGLQTSLEALNQRAQRLESEQAHLEGEQRDLNPERTQREETELAESIAAMEEQLRGLGENHARLRGERGNVDGELHEARQSLQGTQGRLSSLEALVQSASGQEDTALNEWLEAQGMSAPSRLSRALTVTAGWESAVEAALGTYLHGLCVDDLPGRFTAISEWPEATLALVDGAIRAQSAAPAEAPAGAVPLVDHVQGPDAVLALLSGLLAVETLEQALSIMPALEPNQRVVTQHGCCLGPGSLYRANPDGADKGLLEREKTIESLYSTLEQQQNHQKALEERRDRMATALADAEREQNELEPRLEKARKRLNELTANRRAEEAKQAQAREQAARLGEELKENRTQSACEKQALEAARTEREAAHTEAERLEKRAETARSALAEAREKVRQVRAESDRLSEGRQKVELELTSRQAALESTRREGKQLAERLEEVRAQQRRLEATAGDAEAPTQEHEQARDEAREKRDAARGKLESGRAAHSEVQARLESQRDHMRELEATRERLRDELQQARIHDETQAVHQQNIAEQIGETGYELGPLLEGLDEEATIPVWEKKISRLEQRIENLGPINLAAIQEYEQESERSEYLNEQHTDLTRAVATLEEAIHQIDKETRSRFRNTFEQVNNGFQTLFPRLFGGGEAYLEVTGDDLLDTGIRVMARPPGKRNSSIQLLSGGEKAMTAVALVFALFELNPAPFCILDEVDAPLDDANVVRFCDMVKSMSERVQFILITHNKTTMELAHRLHGVTMQEPGVSRLVSVDLEEAAALAG